MTPQRFTLIQDLLVIQQGITSVQFQHGPPDRCVNLNNFRRLDLCTAKVKERPRNLQEIVADAFGLKHPDPQTQWLVTDSKWCVAPIIVARSTRYHDSKFPWRDLVKQHCADMAFVGVPDEHKAFCSQFGTVDFFPTENLLQLTRVIAGCQVFIGNQSCPYAIAEGLKINSIQESNRQWPNCIFNRKNAKFSALTTDLKIPGDWL
jgi:hypothetical protein